MAAKERWAKIGIVVQLLALVRSLAEIFRLKHIYGGHLVLSQVEPYIVGALMAAVLGLVAVVFFFFRRYTATVVVAGATVVLMFAYKVHVFGWSLP